MNIPNLGGAPVILDKRKPKIILEFSADMTNVNGKFENFPGPTRVISVCHLMPNGAMVLVFEPKLGPVLPNVPIPS